MIVAYGAHPTMAVVELPALILLAQVTALGVGTLLAALNVRYRDFRYVVPYLMQFWLFATPVAYSAQLVPADRHVLLGLNPMATVVEGFRHALLGTPAPAADMVAVSVGVAIVALVVGLVYFQRVERTFADVI
jgi:lipopolysaccharide transport system permease protein